MEYVLPPNVESLCIEILVQPFRDYQVLSDFLVLNKHIRSLTFKKLTAESNDDMLLMQQTLQEMPFLEEINFQGCFHDLKFVNSSVDNTILLGLRDRRKPIRRVRFVDTFLGNRTMGNLIELANENLIHSELKFNGSSFTRSKQSLFSLLGNQALITSISQLNALRM